MPTEVIGLKDWIGESRWNHDPVGLLAELPERELSLYGVTKWLDSSALLRWGDSLAEFSWSFGGPLIVEPQLWCWDVDSDGQEEVVVINHVDSGTGTSIEELHVVKKDGDGTLTDYCFPESLWQEDLSGLLSVVSDGDRTYTVLGADLVDLTDEIQTQFPDLNPAMIEDTAGILFIFDIRNIAVLITHDSQIGKILFPSLGHEKISDLGERDLSVDTQSSLNIRSLRLNREIRKVDRIKSGNRDRHFPGNSTAVRQIKHIRLSAELSHHLRALRKRRGFRIDRTNHNRLAFIIRIRAIFFLILGPFIVSEYFKSFRRCAVLHRCCAGPGRKRHGTNAETKT